MTSSIQILLMDLDPDAVRFVVYQVLVKRSWQFDIQYQYLNDNDSSMYSEFS